MRNHTLASRPAATAAAFLCLAGATVAADYPPRKPGLWEMSVGDASGKTPKPGDMMMGNGMKMNVLDMMGGQPKRK